MTNLLFIAVPGLLLVVWVIWGWNPFAATLDTASLLDPGYGKYETGYARQPDGTIVVRALTRMPGVNAEMVRWWFADYMQTTEHYLMWHADDHVWMDWANKKPGEIVGASHLVHERIGGELDKLRIAFIDPKLLFGSDPNTLDRFVLCAKPGPLEEPVTFGIMSHVVRDMPWGAEMRSCFWLGRVDSNDGHAVKRFVTKLIGNTNLVRRLMVKEDKAAGLLKHCIEEMGYLSDFLPELYRAEATR